MFGSGSGSGSGSALGSFHAHVFFDDTELGFWKWISEEKCVMDTNAPNPVFDRFTIEERLHLDLKLESDSECMYKDLIAFSCSTNKDSEAIWSDMSVEAFTQLSKEEQDLIKALPC